LLPLTINYHQEIVKKKWEKIEAGIVNTTTCLRGRIAKNIQQTVIIIKDNFNIKNQLGSVE